MMLDMLARNWRMVLIRGIAAVLFGILAIAWPDLTIRVLVALFGAYALVDGVFAIVSAFQGEDRDRLWHIAQGVLGILVGIIAWVWPDLTAFSLLLFIGAWALVTGVMQIIAAIRLRNQIDNEWLLIIGGVLSVLFGFLCVATPRNSAIALIWVIGIYAIVFGIILITLSFRLRGMKGATLGEGRAAASV
jgi:uncharacterized membrane protein HdeD (DUF308 family)